MRILIKSWLVVLCLIGTLMAAPERSWESLSAAERLARWQALKPEQRAAMRQRLEAFRHLPAPERQRIRQAFQRFHGLPPAQQQRLMQRFQGMTLGEREAFLLALKAQGRAERTHRLWTFVPPAERAATITMMQSLTPPQRQVLRKRAQGLDQQQAQALRRQLLLMSPAQRAEFLQAH